MENEDATFKEYKKVYYPWPRATFKIIMHIYPSSITQTFSRASVLLFQQCKILDSNKGRKIMNKRTER